MNHEDFEQALATWLEGAQAISDRNMEQYKNIPRERWAKLELSRGARYVRVVARAPHSSSAHSFIDTTNGDVLKPASWKAPAKHARGNIFDENNGLRGMGPHGPAYLR